MPGFKPVGVSSSFTSTGYSFESGFQKRLLESAMMLMLLSHAVSGLGWPTILTVARSGLFGSTRSLDTCDSLIRQTAFIDDVSGRRMISSCQRTCAPGWMGVSRRPHELLPLDE